MAKVCGHFTIIKIDPSLLENTALENTLIVFSIKRCHHPLRVEFAAFSTQNQPAWLCVAEQIALYRRSAFFMHLIEKGRGQKEKKKNPNAHIFFQHFFFEGVSEAVI